MSDQELLKSIEKGPGNFSWYWVNPLVTSPMKPLITPELINAKLGGAVVAALKETFSFQVVFAIPVLPLFLLLSCGVAFIHSFLIGVETGKSQTAGGVVGFGTNMLGTVALCCVFIIII